MPIRRLPNSDATRLSALRNAFNKAESLQPGERLAISEETLTSLRELFPVFQREMGERSSAEAVQSEASTALSERAYELRTFVSHFLQVFNLGVERGRYAAAHRAYYGLDVSSSSLPRMSSHSELATWAANIPSGDEKRIAAGGLPMTNPEPGEVAAALEAFNAALAAQSEKAGTLDREQEDVSRLRSTVDSLIRDIWDEVEFAFRRDAPPSLRRKARAYGVVYISSPGEPAEAEETAPDGQPVPADPAS